MDIIDVILGKALTPQGQAASAAATAQQAAQDALDAASLAQTTAETAQDTLDALVAQIETISNAAEGSILFNAVQNLTEEEKARARDNIGALDVNDFNELLVRHSVDGVTMRALRIAPIYGTFNDNVGTLKNADTENGEVEYYARGLEIKLRSGAEYSVTPGYEFRLYEYTPETPEYRPLGLGWLTNWVTTYTAESGKAVRPTFRKVNGDPMTNPNEIQFFIKDATLDYINNSIELGNITNVTGKLTYGKYLRKARGDRVGNLDRATTRYIPVKQGDSLLINALWGGTKYNDSDWMGLYGYDSNYQFVSCLLDMESAYGWTSLNHLEENSVLLDYYLLKIPAGISYIRTSSIYQNKPGAIEPQVFKFLDSAILDINLRGDQINLGSQNVNKVVIVNADGSLTASSITQQMLLNGGGVINPDNPGGGGNNNPNPVTGETGILGLKINYENGTATPADDSVNNGLNLNNYIMYGGRKRCLVNDSGEIIAFYGDNNYNENNTNGYQVMIYQPKFYYKRTVLQTATLLNSSTAIKEELLQISAVMKDDFNIHPLFLDNNNEELDYVLLSAYEGSIEAENQNSYQDIQYNNFLQQKLSSVANAYPITGNANYLNGVNGEKLATNRGTGWHILTSKALSAQQMLAMIEFGTLNTQEILGKGISDFSNNDVCSSMTGSTASFGNGSGQAAQTTIKVNNNTTTYSINGKTAITYRGYENPWSNVWQLIGDLLTTVDQNTRNKYYICNQYNYSSNLTNDYIQLNFSPQAYYGFISAFGYDSNYDWLYLPIEMNSSASSLKPVGDYYYGAQSKNTTCCWTQGGSWGNGYNNGIFSYGCDKISNITAGQKANVRLIYIPVSDTTTYNNNIIKWNTTMGG